MPLCLGCAGPLRLLGAGISRCWQDATQSSWPLAIQCSLACMSPAGSLGILNTLQQDHGALEEVQRLQQVSH